CVVFQQIGASLMSSNVGSGLFIGLAGTGAAGGLAVGGFERNAAWVLIALGWIFVPVYISAGVVTMPEYLRKRSGGQRIRIYMSVLSLILYIFTKISVRLLTWVTALCLNVILDEMLKLVACFNAGGLTAVIYTDAFQTVIIIGAFVLMFIAFNKVGWCEGLLVQYERAVPAITVPNTTCHLPRSDAFHIFRDPVTGDVPWPGLIFGLTVLATWVWCTDQVIVQRSLSAKNLSHAKGVSVLGGYLKVFPLFFVVMPGMISRALYPNEVGCVDPGECMEICGASVGCSNIAYPKLVVEIMPGLMIAVMMAALMVFILLLVALSIVWIPVIQAANSGQLFNYIQSITSYLASPITTVFIMAILWGRVNEQGAFWGLMVGLVVGTVRMVMEFVYSPPSCREKDLRPALLKDVHYLYFALILLALTALIITAFSLCTAPIPEQHVTMDRDPNTYTFKEFFIHLYTKVQKGDKCYIPNYTGTFVLECGCVVSPMWLNEMSEEEQKALERKLTSIEEDHTWKTVCNVNALILLTVNVFLWGYFA
uniref:Solute carrier family 5 member 9 n=1 Tax=Sinocyclocheilus grahami TaxID=75366 RepID=A0A672KIU8_SINGR